LVAQIEELPIELENESAILKATIQEGHRLYNKYLFFLNTKPFRFLDAQAFVNNSAYDIK